MTTPDTITACAWLDDCRHHATTQVERQIRPGLAVVVDICDLHAAAATRLGYQPNALTSHRQPPGAPSADRLA